MVLIEKAKLYAEAMSELQNLRDLANPAPSFCRCPGSCQCDAISKDAVLEVVEALREKIKALCPEFAG